METRLETCPRCGAQIDLATGGCPYCLPEVEKPAAPMPSARPTPSGPPPLPPALHATSLPSTPIATTSAAPRPPTPSPGTAAEGATAGTHGPAGPVEFEAEEYLARGEPTRALVLVSKALKERPDNLTLLALLERSRKGVLRGKRGERLDQRLREAQDLLAQGDPATAEKIVGSALKLVPNHPMALDLFKRLRTERLAAPSAEAEAERELARLASAQAGRALEQARALRAQGNERGAFIAVRRGLRVVPDDRQLLTLFGELEERLGRRAAAHASLNARVHEAQRRLAAGDTEASRRILNDVLSEDPDFHAARAVLEEVRLAHLRRMSVDATPKPGPGPTPTQAPPGAAAPVTVTAATPAPSAPANPWAALAEATTGPRPRATAPPAPVQPAPRAPLSDGRTQPPPEVMLPLTRRRATPLTFIFVGAALMLGVALFLMLRRTPEQRVTPSVFVAPVQTPAGARTAGPWEGIDPSLRAAAEATLTAYGTALEAGDGERLAAARPDLAVEARDALLAPLKGALNVAVDLRVLTVEVGAERASVSIARTIVLVGGASEPPAPADETLRFVPREGGWALE